MTYCKCSKPMGEGEMCQRCGKGRGQSGLSDYLPQSMAQEIRFVGDAELAPQAEAGTVEAKEVPAIVCELCSLPMPADALFWCGKRVCESCYRRKDEFWRVAHKRPEPEAGTVKTVEVNWQAGSNPKADMEAALAKAKRGSMMVLPDPLYKGMCAHCDKPVNHAYPLWTMNPAKPGAKPLHEECRAAFENANDLESMCPVCLKPIVPEEDKAAVSVRCTVEGKPAKRLMHLECKRLLSSRDPMVAAIFKEWLYSGFSPEALIRGVLVIGEDRQKCLEVVVEWMEKNPAQFLGTIAETHRKTIYQKENPE